MSTGLYQQNLKCIQNHWPMLSEQVDESHPGVELFSRDDGFYSAACRMPQGLYTLSPQKEMAAYLYSFRDEVRKSLEDGADLLFLLGIGLGENLKALWETIQCYHRGYVVVLEESFPVLSAACHCSDLQDVFASSVCDLVISSDLSREVCRRIHEGSWFGAQKSVFFWGYQVQESGMQPGYLSLMNAIKAQIAAEQKDFLVQWKEWIHRKACGKSLSHVIVCIHEEETHSPNPALGKPEAMSQPGVHYREIVIPKNQFISQTYLMQRIMETDADELIWYQVHLGKWLPQSIWETLPVSSTFIE